MGIGAVIGVAVGVAVSSIPLGHPSPYARFVGHHFIAPLSMLVGIPTLAFVAYTRAHIQRWIAAVAVVGIVLLLFVARTAVIDANQLHNSNCWKFSGNDSPSTWECAPGRSTPEQWPHTYNDNSGQESSGQGCNYLNTSSSGGTIWHCFQT